MASARKRNDLSLELKYEVIKTSEREPKIGVRKLAEIFKCGKTQISVVLKNADRIKELYQSNSRSDLCQVRKRNRTSEYSDVNEALYQWYAIATSKNIYPDGRQLAEKAKQIAMRLGFSEFKASNGWLDRWKKRHNIKQMRVCGESGDVCGETIESWKERVPHIIEGYKEEDIWNLDETGCFWKALPEVGLGQKAKQCKGGKKSKQRVTVCFIVNAAGEKESLPIVVWRSTNPRCFKGVNKLKLPVLYYNQSKSWMTGDILSDVLSKVNAKLKRKGRSVLLFMDNAGCHPSDLKDKFSNINIVFLPANTTSKLQPLDLGVIMNFKVYYRKLLMQFVLARIIEECSSATEVAKSVTILQAIRWTAQAWDSVHPEVVQKCFRNAGILGKDLKVVKPAARSNEDDPFLSLDGDEAGESDTSRLMELQELVSKLGENTCSTEEFVTADDILPAHVDDVNWEEDFLAQISPTPTKLHYEGGVQERDKNEQEEEEELEEEEDLPTEPRLKSLPEALASLKDTFEYLDYKGFTREATQVMLVMSDVAALCHAESSKKSKQTTLDDFMCNQ